MKKLLLMMLLMTAIPAMSQYTGFYERKGKVVDAETGKPLPSATVTNLRHSVQTDSDGRYTITYHTYDSDLRLYVSHHGYITDTFSIAPELVRLRPLPQGYIQTQNKQSRPTVAVVLSGGGAKGVAHISALRAVEQAGIPVDIVCGTSMGSLIGALYCVGYTTDQLDSLVRTQEWTTLLSDRSDPTQLTLRQRQELNTYTLVRAIDGSMPLQGGLIRGRNLNTLFRRLCSDYLDSISFDSLPIPYACVATDIVTNTEVDFRSGYLIQAMRASMAIPAAFTPVRMGDKVLVDGGLCNNYPADLARKMGADIIIGVSVQSPPAEASQLKDAASVMMQIIDVNSKNKFQDNIAISDVFIQVDVNGYTAASFTPAAIDTLLRRGAEAAALHHDELAALSARIGRTPATRTPHPVASADSTFSATTNRRLSRNPIVAAGFRFDTEEMGALQLMGKLPIHTAIPMGLIGIVRLGKNVMASAEYTLIPPSAWNPSVTYTFRNNNIDIYTAGTRTHNVRYRQHTVDLVPIDIHLHRYDISSGLRWDYFDYYGQLLSSSGNNPVLHDDNYFSYHFSADHNSEDHWYFPTRGSRLHTTFYYHTDNLIGMDDSIGLIDISIHWRINFTPAPRFSIQPMLYGRTLLGPTTPLAFSNALGTESFGHYIEQQMPFAGIGHVEYIGNQFGGFQLQLQYRLGKNHYILLRGAAGIEAMTPEGLLDLPLFYGAQAGYSLNTLFGPIDARIGYSTRTEKPYFYINVGHRF